MIFDQVKQNYTWTSEIGENVGKQHSINYKTLAPASTIFDITSISGNYNSDSIMSISVGYTSKQCDQVLPGQRQTIPPIPTKSTENDIGLSTLITTQMMESRANALIIANVDTLE